MGTDIHLVVQAKRGGTWQVVEPPDLDWHDDFDKKYKRWCSYRNYDAFAILADVRNGYGFAGCATGEAMIPVVPERRGLPPEITPEDADYDRLNLGDHSFHWLTLRELVDYPHWDKQRLSYGVVTSQQYHDEIKGKPVHVNGGPREYSGGVMGPRVRTFEEAAYLAAGAPVDKDTYVQIKWPETYAYSAGRWYTHFLPSLRKWADDNGVAYEDVRIVFGFDS